MGSPYTSVAINNYNANPPTDDGAQTSTNQINWAKIKSKVGDPLKVAIETINTNIGNAFGKVAGQGSTIPVTTDVTLDAAAQGRSFVFEDAGATMTLPSATAVNSPFAFSVANNGTGNNVIEAATAIPAQTINGAASIVLAPGQGGMITCDGSGFHYFGSVAGSGHEKDTKQLFFQTSAPLGWTKLTDLDDVGIKIVSGTATDGGTVAFSSLFGQLTLAAANIPLLTGTSGNDSPDHGHNYVLRAQHVTAGSDNGVFPNTWRSDQTAGTGGANQRHQHSISLGNASPTPLDLRLKYAAAIRAKRNAA